MTRLTRIFILVSGAALALSLGGAVAGADPPAPGTSCGPNQVITTINTCAEINSSCTGYDGMIVGRHSAPAQNVIAQHRAIEAMLDRLAHAHIVKRRFRGLHDDRLIGAGSDIDRGNGGIAGQDIRKAAAHIRNDIQLAGGQSRRLQV